MNETLNYLHGFGNEFESEALHGALPVGQFSPQRPPFGLYAEKFSATAFTVPHHLNRRTWFYRIRPSANQSSFEPYEQHLIGAVPQALEVPVDPMRWSAPGLETNKDFVDGLVTVAANGDVRMHAGISIHLYACDKPMAQRCMLNRDGELLIVPQQGTLRLHTECGLLDLEPGEIVVIPRGMKFSVMPDGSARGYICENHGQDLRLPERGPIGSDGLANARDFKIPVASYVDAEESWEVICKSAGRLFSAALDRNPFDVVAWTGNAAPYKYDLACFNAVGSISFDHPDPSIFTVLTAPSEISGVANVDFVIFPPRWLVAENTFRPPWFHRNVMSEFMGLVHGQYDAKATGFEPGGMSLHNAFVPHGPDADVHQAASEADLAPRQLTDTLAFMFETRFPLALTPWALATPALQPDYYRCWQGLSPHFDPNTSE